MLGVTINPRTCTMLLDVKVNSRNKVTLGPIGSSGLGSIGDTMAVPSGSPPSGIERSGLDTSADPQCRKQNHLAGLKEGHHR